MRYCMASYILDLVRDAYGSPLWRSRKHPESAATLIQEDPIASGWTDRVLVASPMPSQASSGGKEVEDLLQPGLRAYQQEVGLSKGPENASQNTEDWKFEPC